MKLAQKILLINLLLTLFVVVFSTPTFAATLKLSPETGNFAVGQEFDVNIMLDTISE